MQSIGLWAFIIVTAIVGIILGFVFQKKLEDKNQLQ